jgi:hypothetical protein
MNLHGRCDRVGAREITQEIKAPILSHKTREGWGTRFRMAFL